MAMQIQRGLVKYKDRSDIICTYGVSPTGIQYYFLDEAKLGNGNIIVTTTLLEAVDPVAIASHVGVIDPDGNVVIQCVNKSIKPISSDILLVEKAHPTSQNVIDTIKLRDDPNAATRLVTTPATIKDNINKVMDPNGRFVFNDQFSEATIYDINGNNLVNEELYSFIGVDDKRIYFSKNTIDSEVVQYSLTNGLAEEENQVPTLNVETTDITKDVIEKALNDDEDNEEVPVEENVESTEETSEEVPVEETTEYSEESVVEDTPVEENIIPEVDEPTDEYTEEVNIPDVSEAPVEENFEYTEEDNTNEENIIPEVDETAEEYSEEDNTVEEEIPLEVNTEYSEEDNTSEEVYEEPVSEEVEEKEEIVSDRLEETPEEEPEEEDDDDDDSEESGGNEIEYKENYEEDNIDNPVYVEDEYDYGYESDDSYNNLVESYNYSNNSVIPEKNIFDGVTATISNLVELNRNLQSMVDSYEIKLTKCDAARKKLVELSKSQAREISSLNARVARLEADKQLLEAKVNALTPAANGDLVRVMADAHNILGQTRTLRRNKNNY